MHQVAKEYTRGVRAEIREDSETSPRAGAFRRSRDEDGVMGERNNNRGVVNRVLQWVQETGC